MPTKTIRDGDISVRFNINPVNHCCGAAIITGVEFDGGKEETERLFASVLTEPRHPKIGQHTLVNELLHRGMLMMTDAVNGESGARWPSIYSAVTKYVPNIQLSEPIFNNNSGNNVVSITLSRAEILGDEPREEDYDDEWDDGEW